MLSHKPQTFTPLDCIEEEREKRKATERDGICPRGWTEKRSLKLEETGLS
jgi:hypothetical protein